MYNSDTDLLFPMRVIPHLRMLRDGEWRVLVDKILDGDADPTSQIAFVLMMTRMGGCQTCNTHSFRAMRGCTQCGQQTIRRFRGSDKDLIANFTKAHGEVESYIKKRRAAVSDGI
jgi:hypothetical protein